MELSSELRHRWVVSDINEETIQKVRELAVQFNVRLSTIIDLAVEHFYSEGCYVKDVQLDLDRWDKK